MDYNTFNALARFRHGLYHCFERAGDALMNINDALLCDVSARSFVELSLSPFFVRRWPSLYGGLKDAMIDRAALQKLFAAQVTPPAPGQRLVLGVDASSIARPQSPTARDRTYVHACSLPEGSKPVVAGWQYSTLSVLPETSGSWTYVLDNQRIASEQTQGQIAAKQLESVLPLLPVRPLLLADGYYGSQTFLRQTQGLACDKLLRLASNRVLYRPAPPKTGRRGAPKKDGVRFACGQPQTHGAPDQQWSGMGQDKHCKDKHCKDKHCKDKHCKDKHCKDKHCKDKHCKDKPHKDKPHKDKPHLEVACWQDLHFQEVRDVTVCVLRVTRPLAAGSKRDPRVSWFVFCGQALPPLSEIAALYRRRYSLEHSYRVDKQDLLWATPRLRTPEAFEHWTNLVSSVRNQLFLARPLVAAARQPWESRSRAVTPQQVRRAAGQILVMLGTPAGVPQVRGKSPGRRVGAVIKKAPRYPVVYKTKAKATPLV